MFTVSKILFIVFFPPEISSPDSLKPLSFCPNLKTLNIKGNPVCSEPENIDEVKKLLPRVSKLITIMAKNPYRECSLAQFHVTYARCS